MSAIENTRKRSAQSSEASNSAVTSPPNISAPAGSNESIDEIEDLLLASSSDEDDANDKGLVDHLNSSIENNLASTTPPSSFALSAGPTTTSSNGFSCYSTPNPAQHFALKAVHMEVQENSKLPTFNLSVDRSNATSGIKIPAPRGRRSLRAKRPRHPSSSRDSAPMMTVATPIANRNACPTSPLPKLQTPNGYGESSGQMEAATSQAIDEILRLNENDINLSELFLDGDDRSGAALAYSSHPGYTPKLSTTIPAFNDDATKCASMPTVTPPLRESNKNGPATICNGTPEAKSAIENTSLAPAASTLPGKMTVLPYKRSEPLPIPVLRVSSPPKPTSPGAESVNDGNVNVIANQTMAAAVATAAAIATTSPTASSTASDGRIDRTTAAALSVQPTKMASAAASNSAPPTTQVPSPPGRSLKISHVPNNNRLNTQPVSNTRPNEAFLSINSSKPIAQTMQNSLQADLPPPQSSVSPPTIPSPHEQSLTVPQLGAPAASPPRARIRSSPGSPQIMAPKQPRHRMPQSSSRQHMAPVSHAQSGMPPSSSPHLMAPMSAPPGILQTSSPHMAPVSTIPSRMPLSSSPHIMPPTSRMPPSSVNMSTSAPPRMPQHMAPAPNAPSRMSPSSCPHDIRPTPHLQSGVPPAPSPSYISTAASSRGIPHSSASPHLTSASLAPSGIPRPSSSSFMTTSAAPGISPSSSAQPVIPLPQARSGALPPPSSSYTVPVATVPPGISCSSTSPQLVPASHTSSTTAKSSSSSRMAPAPHSTHGAPLPSSSPYMVSQANTKHPSSPPQLAATLPKHQLPTTTHFVRQPVSHFPSDSTTPNPLPNSVSVQSHMPPSSRPHPHPPSQIANPKLHATVAFPTRPHLTPPPASHAAAHAKPKASLVYASSKRAQFGFGGDHTVPSVPAPPPQYVKNALETSNQVNGAVANYSHDTTEKSASAPPSEQEPHNVAPTAKAPAVSAISVQIQKDIGSAIAYERKKQRAKDSRVRLNEAMEQLAVAIDLAGSQSKVRLSQLNNSPKECDSSNIASESDNINLLKSIENTIKEAGQSKKWDRPGFVGLSATMIHSLNAQCEGLMRELFRLKQELRKEDTHSQFQSFDGKREPINVIHLEDPSLSPSSTNAGQVYTTETCEQSAASQKQLRASEAEYPSKKQRMDFSQSQANITNNFSNSSPVPSAASIQVNVNFVIRDVIETTSLLKQIASFLDPCSLCRCLCVSKHWISRNIFQCQDTWLDLCVKRFGASSVRQWEDDDDDETENVRSMGLSSPKLDLYSRMAGENVKPFCSMEGSICLGGSAFDGLVSGWVSLIERSNGETSRSVMLKQPKVGARQVYRPVPVIELRILIQNTGFSKGAIYVPDQQFSVDASTRRKGEKMLEVCGDERFTRRVVHTEKKGLQQEPNLQRQLLGHEMCSLRLYEYAILSVHIHAHGCSTTARFCSRAKKIQVLVSVDGTTRPLVIPFTTANGHR